MALKIIITSGKRKKAIAKAMLRPGSGIVRINRSPIENYMPMMSRLKIQEPLILAEGYSNKADIDVLVSGGGVMGQTEAARLAIARALVEFSKDKALERVFLDYDRHLLVADVRRREVRKPNTHGNARGKVQKSYR